MSRDLLHQDEIRTLVREAYGSVDASSRAVAEKLYSAEELEGMPPVSLDHALGVGNHLRHARIEPGDTVLDLGCGSGIDSILAARRTGPSGRVIALDFLPEMLERTSAAAREAGVENVEPLEGEMEAIPLPDSTIDCVISNGVINLSPRKARALAECARVLRPGGEFCVADVTLEEEELPPEVLTHPAAWAGWVAGALTERDFVGKLERAGFVDIEVLERSRMGIDDCALYPLFTEDLLASMRRLIPRERLGHIAVIAIIRARRATGGAWVKVLEGLTGGIEVGTTVPMAELGLPVEGANGLLLVFWKSTWLGCRQESPAVRNLHRRFAPDGLEVVGLGAFETEEACRAWKEEFELEFPVLPDRDGTLFRTFTNGWVPWSVLVGPDGKVVFSENEFDESGFSNAIQRIYERPSVAEPTERRTVASARCTIVLGGGTGGVVAARELRRRLPTDHRVVLVDRSAVHVYQPSLLWQMVGERRPSEFTRPLERLQRSGIEFRSTEVQTLDLDDRVVVTAAGDLGYDSLVVSLGAQLAPETVGGFDEMALDLYTPEGCGRIHAALRDLTEGVVGILIPAMPFKCPAAPYEAAFLAESFLRRRGIRRKVEIHLFTPEHTPMPVAPAAVGDSIADMLAARGIHYHALFTFQELRPETREVVASDGRAHSVDVLMCVPPHQAPEAVRSSPLLGVSGFVHVDPRTLQTDYDNVYAIGDVATIRLPNGKALPKAGVFAHAEAKVVARRIADAAEGKTADSEFDGHGYCWIELGDGRAGFAGGDFYAEYEPQIKIRRPGRPLHWGKVAFEKWWLHHWF